MEQLITLGNVEIAITLRPDILEISKLPPDTTKLHLMEILSNLMDIQRIEFFNDKYRIDDAFALYEPIQMPLWLTGSYCKVFYSNLHPEFIHLLGQRRWQTRKERTHYVNVEEAERESVAMLEFFDLQCQQESIIDEDGFEMVTSKRKAPITKRKYEKTDFYRFQMKDSKRQKLTELQEKFQDDRIKIQKMRHNQGNLTK